MNRFAVMMTLYDVTGRAFVIYLCDVWQALATCKSSNNYYVHPRVEQMSFKKKSDIK